MTSASETAAVPRGGTRERILDAACRGFARGGRDGVSMREISAETQLTMPTLYHHFGDKSALYAACITHVLESVEQQLRDALHAAADTPREPLRRFTEALCGNLLRHPALLPFLQMELVYGKDPLLRLVPQDLRNDIDSMSDSTIVDGMLPLSAALRLIAVTFGYAVVLRATPSEAQAQPAPPVPADGLLRSARVAFIT